MSACSLDSFVAGFLAQICTIQPIALDSIIQSSREGSENMVTCAFSAASEQLFAAVTVLAVHVTTV